ncbi:MAG TPA: hypothetical protein PLJ32_07040, partial [Kiritimatiellia bacterium]|nr:hypothetical protein [Kiritimatiellia bacterium]
TRRDGYQKNERKSSAELIRAIHSHIVTSLCLCSHFCTFETKTLTTTIRRICSDKPTSTFENENTGRVEKSQFSYSLRTHPFPVCSFSVHAKVLFSPVPFLSWNGVIMPDVNKVSVRRT